MKVKTLLKELYKACISGDREGQKTLWKKALRKSLKNKKTHLIR